MGRTDSSGGNRAAGSAVAHSSARSNGGSAESTVLHPQPGARRERSIGLRWKNDLRWKNVLKLEERPFRAVLELAMSRALALVDGDLRDSKMSEERIVGID